MTSAATVTSIGTPGGGAQPQSLRDRLASRMGTLATERSQWESRWREVRDFIAPYRGRFLPSDRARAAQRHDWAIVNDSATKAAKTLAAGLASSLTNPSMRWFRLETADPSMMRSGKVRPWLSHAEDLIYRVFAKSNFYQQVQNIYFMLGVFGSAPLWQDDDYDDIARFRAFAVGEYYLANDGRGLATVCYRRFEMSVEQVVQTWVQPDYEGKQDWSKLSRQVRHAWDRGNLDQPVVICQGVERASDSLLEREGMPKGMGKWRYLSCYWEEASDDYRQVLQVDGYRECPVHAPRWDLELPDAYGVSPAMEAIGDVRQLQLAERRLAQAVDRVTGAGPLTGPPLSSVAEVYGHAYVPWANPGAGAQVRPLIEVSPQAVAAIGQEVQRVEKRVGESFYADLWRLLSQIEDPRITATAVNELKEEKLVMLGPVVTRQYEELLNPLLDRTFAQIVRASQGRWRVGQPGVGGLPPPPREIAGADLKVEYESVLAQAQSARKADGVTRLLSTAAQMVAYDPSVADYIDDGAAISALADAWGVDPSVIRSDDDVTQLRQAKLQAAQGQQAQQQLSGMADIAHKLGNAKTKDTALGALMQGAGGAMPGIPGGGGEPPAGGGPPS